MNNNNLSVLFLDDDKAVLNALKRRFRRENFISEYITSPQELFSYKEITSVNLLVSDLHMKGVKTVDLLKKFKKICPHGEIIICTGSPDGQELDEIRGKIDLRAVISKTEDPAAAILNEIKVIIGEDTLSADNDKKRDCETLILDKEIEQLIPDYINKRRFQCSQILDALKNGDYSEIFQIGHKLKGIGSLYGFPKISDSGSIIEKSAEEKQYSTIKMETMELIHYLESVEYTFL